MNNKQRSRQPVGTPEGGEFATERRRSSGVSLTQTAGAAELYLASLPPEDRELARAILAYYQPHKLHPEMPVHPGAEYFPSTDDEALDYLGRDIELTTDYLHGTSMHLGDAIHIVAELHGNRGVTLVTRWNDDDHPVGWDASYPVDANAPLGPRVTALGLWSDSPAAHGDPKTGMDAMMEFARGAREALQDVQAIHDRQRKPNVSTELQEKIDRVIGHDDYAQFVADSAAGDGYTDVVTVVESPAGSRVMKFTQNPDGDLTYYEL